MSHANIPQHIPTDRVFAFDIYNDPRIMGELYEGFADVVREAPSDLFWTPLNGGHWVITRMAIAEEIAKDYAVFSASEMQIPRIDPPVSFIPLNLDPPQSIPYRQILMPYFAPKSVQAMEPKIRQWAVHFIEKIASEGRCDFLEDVAQHFPVTIFLEMMGFPFSKFEKFRVLADQFFRDMPDQERYALSGQINAEMAEMLEMRRREPADDLVTVLLNAKIGDRPLSQEELQSICFLLFLAGLDTVVNVMTMSYRTLAGLPLLQKRLREDASAAPGFVEEALRLHGVVNSPRIVAQDAERFGVSFRRGEMVLLLNPQYGRDERENKDALKIDVDRTQRRIFTFSTGPHLCIGHTLARAEIRIFTEEWFKRIPSFQVAEGFKPSFRAGTVMALRGLPLEWTPVASAQAAE